HVHAVVQFRNIPPGNVVLADGGRDWRALPRPDTDALARLPGAGTAGLRSLWRTASLVPFWNYIVAAVRRAYPADGLLSRCLLRAHVCLLHREGFIRSRKQRFHHRVGRWIVIIHAGRANHVVGAAAGRGSVSVWAGRTQAAPSGCRRISHYLLIQF